MTYVEEKYGFRFPFDEINPCLHEVQFGCCGFWDICEKEGFCVIPETYGDGKKYCSMGKRLGFNNLKAVKVKKKIAHFRKYDEKRVK